MNHTKIDSADLDSPRRQFFVRGLRFVVALLVFGNQFFMCVYWGSNLAVWYLSGLFLRSSLRKLGK